MKKNKSILELRVKEIIHKNNFKDPTREYVFHPTRRWRFDFAWVDIKLALEVEGGVFSNGRHSRGVGITNDCEKYNQAIILGWRVLRYTTKNICDIPRDLECLLKD